MKLFFLLVFFSSVTMLFAQNKKSTVSFLTGVEQLPFFERVVAGNELQYSYQLSKHWNINLAAGQAQGHPKKFTLTIPEKEGATVFQIDGQLLYGFWNKRHTQTIKIGLGYSWLNAKVDIAKRVFLNNKQEILNAEIIHLNVKTPMYDLLMEYETPITKNFTFGGKLVFRTTGNGGGRDNVVQENYFEGILSGYSVMNLHNNFSALVKIGYSF